MPTGGQALRNSKARKISIGDHVCAATRRDSKRLGLDNFGRQ